MLIPTTTLNFIQDLAVRGLPWSLDSGTKSKNEASDPDSTLCHKNLGGVEGHPTPLASGSNALYGLGKTG